MEEVTVDLPQAARDLWTGEEISAGPVRVPANGFLLASLLSPEK